MWEVLYGVEVKRLNLPAVRNPNSVQWMIFFVASILPIVQEKKTEVIFETNYCNANCLVGIASVFLQ